jgi:hypothetical protein
MDLVALDRFMRKPGATPLVSLSFGAVTFTLFTLAKWSRSPQRNLDLSDLAYLFAFALVSGVFAAFGVFRKLPQSCVDIVSGGRP